MVSSTMSPNYIPCHVAGIVIEGVRYICSYPRVIIHQPGAADSKQVKVIKHIAG